MKRIWKEIALAALLGVVMPGTVLGIAASVEEPEPVIAIVEQTGERTTEATEPVTEPVRLTVPILMDGQTVEMELDEYLVGVVLGEVPVSFEVEAQKAQAIVARTYTMRAHTAGGKHGGAAVCTNPGCCQNYIAPEDYLASGGTQAGVDRIRGAVEATNGMVLTYDGQLIEATYFSCSGGSTEDAAAVWGTEYPYLQAVDSPGEEDAASYSYSVTFTRDQFAAALGRELPGIPASWFGVTTYTTGGGVATMEICGQTYQGTTLRSVLKLRSTAFTVAADSDTVTITTRGFGHRVGMSQYGADAMAVLGSTCGEILAHYYRGTTLTRLEN